MVWATADIVCPNWRTPWADSQICMRMARPAVTGRAGKRTAPAPMNSRSSPPFIGMSAPAGSATDPGYSDAGPPLMSQHQVRK
jgi:hypothetical protein